MVLWQIGPNAFENNMEVTNVRLYQSAILDPVNFPEYSILEVFSAATYDLADFESHLGR